MLDDPIIFCLLLVIIIFLIPIILSSEIYTIKTVIYAFTITFLIVLYRDDCIKQEAYLEYYMNNNNII